MARLLAGELPATEAAAVQAQIEKDPALSKLFRAVQSADLSGIDASHPDVEVALRRVRMRMQRPAPQQPLARFWIPVAATLAAAAGVLFLTRTTPETPATVAVTAPQVFRTSTGVRDTVSLADGSTVVLGPGSELTVNATYPAPREVTLRGQARFDVVHDTTRPFTVRTSQAVVTDLGTVFTINDFDGSAIDVTVQSGSVRLSTAQKPDSGVVLNAGDAGAISTRGVLTREAKAASDNDLAWMTGRLVFRDAPMIKVRAELRRWFGVELVTNDSVIAAGHLNATFRDEPLSQIYEAIALSFGAKYEVHGDTVILKGATGKANR
jgi:transmembrane sensor